MKNLPCRVDRPHVSTGVQSTCQRAGIPWLVLQPRGRVRGGPDERDPDPPGSFLLGEAQSYAVAPGVGAAGMSLPGYFFSNSRTAASIC